MRPFSLLAFYFILFFLFLFFLSFVFFVVVVVVVIVLLAFYIHSYLLLLIAIGRDVFPWH